jgi:Uma2 family endonuclease
MRAPGLESDAAATRIVPLSVGQYHRMIEAAILTEGEPIELIDGLLVRKDRSAVGGDPITVGHAHRLVVTRLLNLVPRLHPFGCHLSVQNPITLPPRHEPEPDGAIVRGVPEDYGDRHPGPADILCVIEVAESSLSYDRTTKLRIYADAGIPQYILVNIPDRQIEVYEEPLSGEGHYASKVVVQSPQSLRIATGLERHLEILVDDLLPALG